MPDDGDLLLDVDIARKRYTGGQGDLDAIAGLRFALPRGKVTCLLGPSGCGKTTALRILAGLDRAYDGAVTPDVATLRLGMVFQDPRLLPWRTVEENVRLAAPAIDDTTLDALFADLALTDWRQHRPGALSVGMARRVAVARALAVAPDLLVLDEAFVSLDEQGADILRDYVFAAARARGATILTVTHSLREALQYSDIILILAPRPTRVLARFPFDAAPEVRNAAWIEGERDRLIAANPGLQP
ncbi:ATP-binding cassette domain-containing protein [Beijerinckia sp. L45]|uniref:ATP-binding cassette domain-containing protein n=1 Tax=Beijerinckia sp. L45 TaxID=1641855 RepID=UPI00131B33CA|nr:ATP-binding cassette domain-containing protein [Beijerinckia sp. L45]